MQLTPNGAFDHIKESIVQYLETAYRISDPSVFQERGEILRRCGTVAQEPFIEATPAFVTSHKLATLEHQHPDIIPAGLSELVLHGVPVDQFALYTHQEEALLRAYSDQSCLLVATGTGSGKTEAFVLPILSDILREAQSWPEPIDVPQRGQYNAQANIWLHSRRHESRPAALRAIILYPMNALVNDQLSRLRRVLALGNSPNWQRRNLNGNLIHFGRYTGLSHPTGSCQDEWRRDRFNEYMKQVEQDWQNLRPDLRETGFWPRPDSPEMLCRWDMQAAPPDIMVTNYSMLEYMLVRPIEYPIFAKTKQWLHETPEARITLVLDEAHTYTGAKGTEVAYLIRRLKERLGLEPGSPKFRAIATTASLPNAPGSEGALYDFIADLFGEPRERFGLIQLAKPPSKAKTRVPRHDSLAAFARFHQAFNIENPFVAIDQLADDLKLGLVDHTLSPEMALYSLLESNEDIEWVRTRTARNATLLDELANECWEDIGEYQTRERATAGVLSAGSYARPSTSTDVPPLISTRIHAFFRGIGGIWACMDPNCSEIPLSARIPGHARPVGRLYTEPRPWCDCGARVLELFSCRRCGLLFLGGIPDSTLGSLWPWSDDLSGERQDIREFRIFGVESPHSDIAPEYRSTRTTLPCHPNDPFARPIYETEETTQGENSISPFPNQCPRCRSYRQPGVDGREVIEPLRTKGPQSFSLIVEDGFRVQPRASKGEPPNFGRKALLFSDSRQEAAKLAGDLRVDHARDLFRQLLCRGLYSCTNCGGVGHVTQQTPYRIGQLQETVKTECPVCSGAGLAARPVPLPFEELRGKTIDLQLALGIDPTNDEQGGFFSRLSSGDPGAYEEAEMAFNVALRRELAEVEFSLEPLGLASWRVRLPDDTGKFDLLTEEETKRFIRCVARILATENILLPPKPYKPWEWPRSLVKDYERQVIVPASGRPRDNVVPYNLTHYRKLGRYVQAIGQAMIRDGRLVNEAALRQWIAALYWPLWKALIGFGVLEGAGAKIDDKIPNGIRIDSFELHPVGDQVHQCQSCAYVMSETILDVCLRCGQNTQAKDPEELHNYYRRAALHALPSSPFDDPYPLRASEHSAQIKRSEAQDLERWFQDLFHDDQNPLDHRVDVLSVTTTMEMGIDIGSLLCVGLRNIPPSVANYQQRAGRAGRRGSAIATVLSFAQQRSHDQYYFAQPPAIVSEPPRVPTLYLANEVVAHRHVRALVLQDFFFQTYGSLSSKGLFNVWGTVAQFASGQTANRLTAFLATNRVPLSERAKLIVHHACHEHIDGWLDALTQEVQRVVDAANEKDDLLVTLIAQGPLPKYAFPIDVVQLSIPSTSPLAQDEEEWDSNSMQRDLAIALSEYAPGSEVIVGSFPNTFIFKSAGIYDPFDKQPDYRPIGHLVECQDCQAIDVIPSGRPEPMTCPECGSLAIVSIPYLRPPGFTVDAALRNAGGEKYEGGGRERSGYVAPARLLAGQTSFNGGIQQKPFALNLYTLVRVGDLFVCNKGPDPHYPGFLICPVCGRSLDPDDPSSHAYPANVPPHRGKNRGPRAGSPCPNRSQFDNQVILGHRFHSEIILLGVDLPSPLDAPFWEPSGRAIWYSFGTLLANAAALVLQIDASELQVGVRPVYRSSHRIHGEVFLYDNVPGGAGYARAVGENLEEILHKALELGTSCANPDCTGACYHCMYDYRNQFIHPLLDKNLGIAVLKFLLQGATPSVSSKEQDRAASALAEFARIAWNVRPATQVSQLRFPIVLEDKAGQRIGLWVIHPLQARPSEPDTAAVLAQSGIRCAVHTSFDLERRPFWVLNNLIRI